MTEKDYEKIKELHEELKAVESNEAIIIRKTGLNNETLFNSVSKGMIQYKGEVEGNNLPMSIIVDKIYYENQNRIRKVVIDILREELDKIVLKKKDLKLQFKNIKVVGCGKEKGNNED